MKFNIASRFSQITQIGLRVALVSAHQMLGKRDVGFLALPMPCDNCIRNIVKTLRFAGAGVKYSGDIAMLEEP